MTNTTPESFDIGALFSGDHRAIHEVKVIPNEALSFAVYQAEQAVKQAELVADEKLITKLRKEFDKLIKEVKNNVVTVKLRSLIDEETSAIREEINQRFPEQSDVLGRVKPNPVADREYLLATWKAHIVEFRLPDGSFMNPSHDDIETFYNQSGKTAQNVINDGILELSNGSKSGAELAFKELDFL